MSQLFRPLESREIVQETRVLTEKEGDSTRDTDSWRFKYVMEFVYRSRLQEERSVRRDKIASVA
jgi:hypothetical protein